MTTAGGHKKYAITGDLALEERLRDLGLAELKLDESRIAKLLQQFVEVKRNRQSGPSHGMGQLDLMVVDVLLSTSGARYQYEWRTDFLK